MATPSGNVSRTCSFVSATALPFQLSLSAPPPQPASSSVAAIATHHRQFLMAMPPPLER
ncbi:hypothetical protein [Streptomyces sp. NPDC012510]|uniref:hypothetical protein n=1 Tax=Streptomyces sp. NPDC012510 TaxID=3364838 RepID=UPI0036EEB06F